MTRKISPEALWVERLAAGLIIGSLALIGLWIFVTVADRTRPPAPAASEPPAPTHTSRPTPTEPRQAEADTFQVFAPKDPFETEGSGTGDSSGVVVELLGTSSGERRSSRVLVGGALHDVREGQVFASNYKLVAVAGDCAWLLFGDEQFSLCRGERLRR